MISRFPAAAEESDSLRSSAFKPAFYAADGTQITMAIEAEYDKKVLRVRFEGLESAPR